MNTILWKYLMLIPREGENGSGAGAGGTGGGADGGGGGAGGDGGGNPGAGGSGTGEGKPPSPNPGQNPTPYFPEGLPDNLKGEDERKTMDNMANALKGFRERDAKREVPKDPNGYLSLEGVDPENFKLDDDVKPHFDFLAKDPGALAALDVFQKAGVDRGVVREAVGKMFGALKEGGLLEPLIDPEAERQALLPESAKSLDKQSQDQAIDRRMQENEDFLKLMSQNKALPPEVAEYAQLMLFDSARGHNFLEWVRGVVQGGQSAGAGQHGGGGGGDTREGLKAELAAMEAKRGAPDFDQAAYKALDERYKKLFS